MVGGSGIALCACIICALLSDAGVDDVNNLGLTVLPLHYCSTCKRGKLHCKENATIET